MPQSHHVAARSRQRWLDLVPEPPSFSLAGAVGTVEALEDTLGIIGRNARPMVANFNHRIHGTSHQRPDAHGTIGVPSGV